MDQGELLSFAGYSLGFVVIWALALWGTLRLIDRWLSSKEEREK